MYKGEITFIIPSYNGYNLLRDFLPSLCGIASTEKIDAEIIVVDDASTDNSVDGLKKLALPVRIVTRDNREGFTKACKEGAENASGSFIFFMNNDMTFEDHGEFISPIIRHFGDGDVFAVAPSSLIDWRGELLDETPTAGRWKKGFLDIPHPGSVPVNERDLFHASGGCMCVRKDRYFELGGFDELFSPFYFEDVDLCWRARKRGWKIIHEPSVRLYHKSHETINKLYSPVESNAIYWKNYFLFIWKNINDQQLCEEHFDNLIDSIYEKSREGQAALLGFKLAMRIFRSHEHKQVGEEIGDRQLLHIINS